MEKLKLAFVCGFWNNAGTEIAAINWLNFLSNEYDVTLYLLVDKINLKGKISSKIKVKQNFWYSNYYGRVLVLTHWKLINFKIIQKFRHYIWNLIFKDGEYNAILNFPDSSATFFKYLKFEKTKLIAWNHFNYGEDVSFVHGNLNQLRDKYYNGYLNSSEIICVSEHAKNSFNKFFASKNTKFNVNCIYTPQNKELILKKSKQKQKIKFQDGFNVVHVARIDSLQKGQLRLLEAINECKFNKKVNFYFIGDATKIELQKFNELVEKLKLENIYYLGKKQNPYPYINNCDLFILPSFFEGFGLVVQEALILQKPVLVTNMTSKEILENESYGNVCSNTKQGIKKSLENIINDEKNFQNLINKTNKYQYSDFQIANKFKTILNKGSENE